jgi:hypothetical protein
MTAVESKGIKKGSRVYWRGDATDGGNITEMSWDAVTIAWDNGQVATVHHGDMREIQRAPVNRLLCKLSIVLARSNVRFCQPRPPPARPARKTC